MGRVVMFIISHPLVSFVLGVTIPDGTPWLPINTRPVANKPLSNTGTTLGIETMKRR